MSLGSLDKIADQYRTLAGVDDPVPEPPPSTEGTAAPPPPAPAPPPAPPAPAGKKTTRK